MNTEINIFTVLQRKSPSLFSSFILLEESYLNPESHPMLRKIKALTHTSFGVLCFGLWMSFGKKSLQKMNTPECKCCLHSEVFTQPSENVC